MCSTTRSPMPGVAGPADQDHRLGGLRRVQAGHELVEQEEGGAGGQGPGQLQAPALQEGQPGGRPGPLPPQPHPGQALLGLRPGRGPPGRPPAVELADQDVVEHGQPGELTNVLERPGNPVGADLVRSQPGDVGVAHPDPARVGPEGPGDEVEEGGLARPVRPITPRTCPARTSRLTSCTARSPANARDTPSRTNRAPRSAPPSPSVNPEPHPFRVEQPALFRSRLGSQPRALAG